MTDGLIAFVAARLDEDEAAARAAGAARWHQSNPDRAPGFILDDTDSIDNIVVYDEGSPSAGQAAHIARHDPARVLREAAAKRALVAAHGPDLLNRFGSIRSPLCLTCITDREGYEELWEADQWPCLTLRQLAAVWSNHPDYDRAWAPEGQGR